MHPTEKDSLTDMVLKACTLLLVALSGSFLQAATFRFSVERPRILRNQRGQLQIDESGVLFLSKNGKTGIRIPYPDIREADVSDRRTIRLELYDTPWHHPLGRRSHTFRLLQGTVDEDLTRFLIEKLKRPVIGTFTGNTKVAFTIPSYHRHRLGGCHGEIQISPDAIRFLSDKSGESRTWLYREIETIGSADPFHFRVSSFAETYNFELKDRLDQAAYELAWRRLYGNLDGFEPLQQSPVGQGDEVITGNRR